MRDDGRPDNPITKAYGRILTGREVDPLKLISAFRHYVQDSNVRVIQQICDKTGQIAVSAQRITKRQRIKYRDARIQTGRNTFYLFDGHRIPADVGANLEIEQGVCVYQ